MTVALAREHSDSMVEVVDALYNRGDIGCYKILGRAEVHTLVSLLCPPLYLCIDTDTWPQPFDLDSHPYIFKEVSAEVC